MLKVCDGYKEVVKPFYAIERIRLYCVEDVWV